MIHVASLIHDDVLDEAEVRRGGMAVHKLYSNKVGRGWRRGRCNLFHRRIIDRYTAVFE